MNRIYQLLIKYQEVRDKIIEREKLYGIGVSSQLEKEKRDIIKQLENE